MFAYQMIPIGQRDDGISIVDIIQAEMGINRVYKDVS